jgi:MFS family permease
MARLRIRRERLAISTVFTMHGAVTGSLATRLPAISDQLHLSPGIFGLVLLMPAVGGLATMPFSGRLIHRLGARGATRLLITLWAAALVLPATAVNPAGLIVVQLFYGMAAGSSDVAMNAKGVDVELLLGRSIMSSLHGLWSVGGFLGSGIGTAMVALGVNYRLHLIGVAVVLTALAPLVGSALSKDTAGPVATEPAPKRFSLPTGRILLLGLVAFCAAFAEGSGIGWSALYMNHVAGAGQALAAGTYTTFACVMAVLRLTGDGIVSRLGGSMVVRAGGVVATVGAILVVLARTPVLALAGFILLGAGIAAIVPLTFAVAGRLGPHPGQAIAGVATVSYGASLIAPGLIGGISQLASLSAAFIVVAVLCAGIGFGGRLVPRRD